MNKRTTVMSNKFFETLYDVDEKAVEETRKMMGIVPMKRKPIIILNALLDGIAVETKDEKYMMDAEKMLCVERESSERGTVYLPVGFGDFPLKDFIKWAEKLPDDVVRIVAMNHALTIGRKG